MKLPGTFEKDKTYLMSGATLIAWRDALLADRITAGPGLKETSAGKAGRILALDGKLGPGGTVELVGAFYRLFTNDAGHTLLQGGTVSGANGGSATIADYKVIDASTGPVAADGRILYLRATCSATLEDGVLLPGCELTSAALANDLSVPDNHAFTTSAATGDIHYELGRWTDAGFLPAGPPGNFLASGCIGNFSLTRV
jgi:hypothetical protein